MAKRVKVDEEVMTEHEFNRRLDVAHWGGRSDAALDAQRAAETKSGEHFAARQDEQARIWRQVADWLRGRWEAEEKVYKNLKDGVTDDECK